MLEGVPAGGGSVLMGRIDTIINYRLLRHSPQASATSSTLEEELIRHIQRSRKQIKFSL